MGHAMVRLRMTATREFATGVGSTVPPRIET
jgi:hypothetical protein